MRPIFTSIMAVDKRLTAQLNTSQSMPPSLLSFALPMIFQLGINRDQYFHGRGIVGHFINKTCWRCFRRIVAHGQWYVSAGDFQPWNLEHQTGSSDHNVSRFFSQTLPFLLLTWLRVITIEYHNTIIAAPSAKAAVVSCKI